MRTVNFGVIGAGLMGREFASVAARWFHLSEMDVRPNIIAVCDINPNMTKWFEENIQSVRQVTTDYREVLHNPDVEAVYIAVPHNLHAELYCSALEAGKYLLGEKPFGIDKSANDRIQDCIQRHPDCFARCSSESPFFPAMQRIGKMLEQEAFGTILEVNSSLSHCSDMNPDKPINWKRMIEYNGEYGCLGDLGLHTCHMPFRAGWFPKNVRACLSKIVKERPDGRGGKVPCLTWDNATLLCEVEQPQTDNIFPLTIKTQRICPGEKNTWSLDILGTRNSVRWSSKDVNTLKFLEYSGGEQPWQVLDMGHETAFKSITGVNFECGFSDVILQMWAAFLYELHHGKPLSKFSGCVTPEEAAYSHRLFTAALQSHKTTSVVTI